MLNPKVSVVTITYNLLKAEREKTFRQCVESVHNQTYQNIEHIVIDGASNDGTLDMIKEYEEKGWVKCYSEPDKGIYDAMNKGIDKATGEYIAFLNSDDFWHDQRGVEESVKALVEKNADFSYAPCNFLDSKEKIKYVDNPQIGIFYFKMPFCHQTMFTKREKMLALGKFDLKYKSAGDYDFIIRLILSGAKGVEVPLNFTSFRLNGFSGTQNNISVEETHAIYKALFTKYGFPENDAYLCARAKGSKKFIDVVLSVVDKDIGNAVETIMSTCPLVDGYYHLFESEDISYNSVTETISKVGIPLLKMKIKGGIRRYYLFGFLPILKTKKAGNKKKYYVFGLPVMKITKKQ